MSGENSSGNQEDFTVKSFEQFVKSDSPCFEIDSENVEFLQKPSEYFDALKVSYDFNGFICQFFFHIYIAFLR